MKQIIQHLSSGETILAELPTPAIRSGQLLIKTHRSLVYLSTEKMLVDYGKAGYTSKALIQPKKVKQVLEKIKFDWLLLTLYSRSVNLAYIYRPNETSTGFAGRT
jgi:hypothetical protein